MRQAGAAIRRGAAAVLAAVTLMLTAGVQAAPARDREVTLRFIATTDVHGNYFPYDFIARRPGDGSLARVATYVEAQRRQLGRGRVVLLDNGDILQGQPSAYYYNFVDTASAHVCAAALNFMGYDAGTVGNHDVETGHAVYDRWVGECAYPVLGANVTDRRSGRPYWSPYTIVEREGLRIAVLGLLTPTVPDWLPENLWAGLAFEDMVETARRWMPVMRGEERADVVVGLFHSGVGTLPAEGGQESAEAARCLENASLRVAQAVPGFDVIFCGHDHRQACTVVRNVAGDSVPVLNPAAGCLAVAEADVTLRLRRGRVTARHAEGRLVDVTALEPSEEFCRHFAPQREAVGRFVDEIVGRNEAVLTTRPAYFGPSAFVDFIHTMQLRISGADVSFAAPLSFDAVIPEGDIRVADMFTLYKYENLLYVMRLSGREIKDYLECSYAGWTRRMAAPGDTLLRFCPQPERQPEAWARLSTPSYNFDSAAGLLYTVDVRQPEGSKVSISGLADGRPFSPDSIYTVAVNSYRGNGGGGLLTRGAGIAPEQLRDRVVWSTDKDLRFYLMEEIRRQGRMAPQPRSEWRFVPEAWVDSARPRDEKVLFGSAGEP